MKKLPRSVVGEPTMMLHHIKEFQIRVLVVVAVLILGMVVGYYFYEPLFAFIKAPLGGPLHYTSPAGSFSFVIKICLLVGTIAVIPVAVYNAIMFIQPALRKKLTRARVHFTTFFSLLLAAAGASFAFLVIIPLALQFFFKFQVDGLVALISADDYLKFVVNVIITFVLIFQLPLLISLIDHITPLTPKKLFKAEKYVIVGSVAIGVLVPFALDPVVQLLIASPIIILYNISIGIVLIQQRLRARALRRELNTSKQHSTPVPEAPRAPTTHHRPATPSPILSSASMQPSKALSPKNPAPLADIGRPTAPPLKAPRPIARATTASRAMRRSPRLITDMRPAVRKTLISSSAATPAPRSPLRPPVRTLDLTRPMSDVR